MYPNAIQRLIGAFSRFPTIGPRAASRFVFYIMRASDSEIEELIRAIRGVKEQIKLCSFCFNPYQVQQDDAPNNECTICSDNSRDSRTLCLVEKESDLEAIEKTKQYRGRYFVLGGVQNVLKKDGLQSMRIDEFKKRIAHGIQEVIIAINPTAEGESAALYIERSLQPFGIQVTRLARGLPQGGELEYADQETIRSALNGRK